MENVRDQILQNLESIVEKTGQLESIEGKIPQIEIDIILKEIQKLYESFKFLGQLSSGEFNKKDDSRVDEIISRSEETLSKIESISKEISKEDDTNPKIEDAPKTSAEPEKKVNTYKEELETKVEVKKEMPKETIGEKLQDNQQSINEKIAADKPDNSIGSKMQMNPISDLKVAIGINEKFLLTNELFKGNNEEYNKAITKLNQMEGLNSALEILNSLKLRHQWENNQDAYDVLYDLVKRRYS